MSLLSGFRFQVSSFRVSVVRKLGSPSRDTACRVRNIHDDNLCIDGHGMPWPYKPLSVICHLSSVLCHLSSVLCHPYSVLCHPYSAIRTLSSVLCTLYSVLCPNERTSNACSSGYYTVLPRLLARDTGLEGCITTCQTGGYDAMRAYPP